MKKLVICGMGGSGLPARALISLEPKLDIVFHNGFGSPDSAPDNALYVAISYSGNTQETLSFAREGLEKDRELAIVTSGGELLALAEEHNLKHSVVKGGMTPRDAFPELLKGLCEVTNHEILLHELSVLQLDMDVLREEGRHLAEGFRKKVPLIYSSLENAPLAYFWKIFINESAKYPAFINTFSELTHNELESLMSKATFDTEFKVLILYTERDSVEVRKQMEILKEMRGAELLPLPRGKLEGLMTSWTLARNFARALAEYYDVDPDKVPHIEEFKSRVKNG